MHHILNLISPVLNPISKQERLDLKSLKATKSKSIKDNTSFITSLSKRVSNLPTNSLEAKTTCNPNQCKSKKRKSTQYYPATRKQL